MDNEKYLVVTEEREGSYSADTVITTYDAEKHVLGVIGELAANPYDHDGNERKLIKIIKVNVSKGIITELKPELVNMRLALHIVGKGVIVYA